MSDNTTGVSFTIPAQTPLATPVSVPANLGLSDLLEVVCVIPPGCAGNVGFSIWAGGSLAYPDGPQPWFVFDDYTFTQEISSQIDSGQWAIHGYNTDQFPHTLQFYFKWNNLVASPDLTISPLVSI